MENFDELALTWDEPRRVERAKVIADEIIKAIPDLDKMTGFEYGCGTGLLSFNLQSRLKYITLGDNSPGMLSVVMQKIEKVKVENMTPILVDLAKDEMIDERKYDLIYTFMTLHHIEDIDKVFDAFTKMLNPRGYLCIIDLDKEDGSFHGDGFTGHNGFNRKELAEKLVNHGFGDLSCKTCFENIKKSKDGTERKYPLFLMVGQKQI
ncbi:MAG TPA: class I SAM-dependent methyltransferase [Bacillota bacterium]|nr:class I SAM-dependent methyltransferase [Bacillota bacterium]